MCAVFDYHHKPKVWVNRKLFLDCLLPFYDYFATRNSTSKIKLMDAGVIVDVTWRYLYRQIGRALDDLSENTENMYKVSQITAMISVVQTSTKKGIGTGS